MSQVQSRTALKARWVRLRPLYLVLIVCIIPVVASYLAYYVFQPASRTNYGALIDPQVAVPPLSLTRLDGTSFDLASLRGEWVMLTVDRAECAEPCQKKLWNMRQVRTATGKERDRIERVFLIVDDAPTTTLLLREYEGTHFVRASAKELGGFLALPQEGSAVLEDCVWLIDPLGHLMLRWPKAADPTRMKKDMDKLLSASRIG
jgi:peroxiredoxin